MPQDMNSSVVQKLSPTHEQMLNWVLENPGKTLREMSAAFGGYSLGWLSRIVNSDLFQARLHEREEAIFARVAEDIPTRLRGLAHIACDRMEEKLEDTQDPRFIRESFDAVMHRLGFAPNTRGAEPGVTVNAQQNNFFTVSKEQLGQLRGVMHGSAGTTALPAPAEVLEAASDNGRLIPAEPASVYVPQASDNGKEGSGS